jgi:hypothetical protein
VVVYAEKLDRARGMVAKGLTEQEAATRLGFGKTFMKLFRLTAGELATSGLSKIVELAACSQIKCRIALARDFERLRGRYQRHADDIDQ